MSGTFPSTPKFMNLSVSSIQPTLEARTISGRRQARQIAGQYWVMTATFPPMTRAEFSPIWAFIITQRGSFDTFLLQPTVHKDTQGNSSGSPKVKNASQTGRTITTDGWPTSATVMKAGDFVKFANHTKVYMLTADLVCDTNGDATMAIEPALITSPATDSAITFSSVPFTCYVDQGNTIEYNTDATGFFQYEVEFCEAF